LYGRLKEIQPSINRQVPQSVENYDPDLDVDFNTLNLKPTKSSRKKYHHHARNRWTRISSFNSNNNNIELLNQYIVIKKESFTYFYTPSHTLYDSTPLKLKFVLESL
jgi:hypothetical protein